MGGPFFFGGVVAEQITKYENGWEVDWDDFTKLGRSWCYKSRHTRPDPRHKKLAVWLHRQAGFLRRKGCEPPSSQQIRNCWEIDATKRKREGLSHAVRYFTWARNTKSRNPKYRGWGWVRDCALRQCGITLPQKDKRRKHGWEFDWTRVESNSDPRLRRVWGRNLLSNYPSVREWGWRTYSTVNGSGQKWQRPLCRPRLHHGYVSIHFRNLSPERQALALKYGLVSKNKQVKEHRLIAAEKYGDEIRKKPIVRHIDGNKSNNDPANLVLGSHAENMRDHETARIEAMRWRERAEKAEERVKALEAMLMLQEGHAQLIKESNRVLAENQWIQRYIDDRKSWFWKSLH